MLLLYVFGKLSARTLLTLVIISSVAIAAPVKSVGILYSKSDRDQALAAEAIARALRVSGNPVRVKLVDNAKFKQTFPIAYLERALYSIIDGKNYFGREGFVRNAARGWKTPKISDLPNTFSTAKISAYIKKAHLQKVISLDPEMAHALGLLREKKLAERTTFIWVNVASPKQSFLPRISQTVNHTFVLDSDTEANWLAAGLPGDKVSSLGITARSAASSEMLTRALNKISDYVFAPGSAPTSRPVNLGVENGTAIAGTQEALAALESDSPADVEILMAYGKSDKGSYIKGEGRNPFGHIAISIRGRVYTINGLAKPSDESHFVHESTLNNYLYAVDGRDEPTEQHTDTFGEAYARENISIRVRGLRSDQLAAMAAEAHKIEAGWHDGSVVWTVQDWNCVEFVEQVLRAGGIDTSKIKSPRGKVNSPLDSFTRFIKYFSKRRQFETDLIFYSKVDDSRNEYDRSNFPITPYQFIRAVKTFLIQRQDPLESQPGKRIAIYPGDPRAHYENLNQNIAAGKLLERCNVSLRNL